MESLADVSFDRIAPTIVYLSYRPNIKFYCKRVLKMSGKITKITFIALIIISVPVFINLISPAILNLSNIIRVILLSLLFLLGLAFLVIVLKNPVTGLLRRYLVLTALNAVIIPCAVLFHNWCSNLSGTREDIFFFFIAVIICPLGFLAGIVGSLILSLKSTQKPAKET